MPVELMPLFSSPGLAGSGIALATAPTLVGSSTSFFTSSGATSYTIAHTVPAGANCLAVYIGAGKVGFFEFTGYDWNGMPLTELTDSVGFNFAQGGSASWIGGIANPATGTHDLTVTFDAAPDSMAFHLVNLAGVDVSGGAAAMVHATDEAGAFFSTTTTSLALELITTVPTLIFGGMSLAQPGGAASYTPHSGVMELADGIASGAAASRHFVGYRRETIAGTYGFGATCTQAGAPAAAAVAFRGA
jgi:hypothetical protein